MLRTVKLRKANWNCSILHRSCLLRDTMEEELEEMGRRRRRRKQLLSDLKERKGTGN